jgi:hypothetical protein
VEAAADRRIDPKLQRVGSALIEFRINEPMRLQHLAFV